MIVEERSRMISEDYADLLITYDGNLNILNGFQDSTVHIINFFDAVVHVPVTQLTTK